MFKIISSIVISMPILVYGYYQSYKEEYRLTDLLELYKALNIFKNEISYLYSPIGQSFYNISTKINAPISNIFLTISQRLNDDFDSDFETIFRDTIKDYSSSTYLNNQDIKEFISLGNTINHLDVSSVISAINIFDTYIEHEIESIEKSKAQTKKTYQSLTILSTILIIIILL